MQHEGIPLPVDKSLFYYGHKEYRTVNSNSFSLSLTCHTYAQHNATNGVGQRAMSVAGMSVGMTSVVGTNSPPTGFFFFIFYWYYWLSSPLVSCRAFTTQAWNLSRDHPKFRINITKTVICSNRAGLIGSRSFVCGLPLDENKFINRFPCRKGKQHRCDRKKKTKIIASS